MPVRTITRGPRHHLFAYYDKLQFDPQVRYCLGNAVGFEHRSPTAADAIEVGMVDLADGDRWIRLGESRAWGWQQGCMLQWVPSRDGLVIYNDREAEGYVARVHEVASGTTRTLPTAVYAPLARWPHRGRDRLPPHQRAPPRLRLRRACRPVDR